MELKGKLKKIGETQAFGPNNFEKRECVVTTEEQYPQDIQIEFTQQNTDLLDAYAVGQDVKIQINLRGREWINPEGVAKYFNTIQGWKIEGLVYSAAAPAEKKKPNEKESSADAEKDDLPF